METAKAGLKVKFLMKIKKGFCPFMTNNEEGG